MEAIKKGTIQAHEVVDKMKTYIPADLETMTCRRTIVRPHLYRHDLTRRLLSRAVGWPHPMAYLINSRRVGGPDDTLKEATMVLKQCHCESPVTTGVKQSGCMLHVNLQIASSPFGLLAMTSLKVFQHAQARSDEDVILFSLSSPRSGLCIPAPA